MKKETSKNTVAEESKGAMIYEEPSEEQLQQELQEIIKKRKAYQEEIQEEIASIRKENAARKRRGTFSVVKAAVIVLVAGTCLFAFSMRSEATRMWWLERVEQISGTDNGHVVDNDKKRILPGGPEEQAIAEIEEKAKIPMPKLNYRPAGLIFDSYDYDEVISRGGIYYLYGEYTIMLNAHTADENSAYSWNYDGEILYEEIVETEYDSVKLREIKAEGDVVLTSVAEWTYHNHQYQIAGKLPFQELKQIIENIFY